MTEIDGKAIREEILRVARENPDHVYTTENATCRYMDAPKQPGCLVGTALFNLGKPVPEHLEGMRASGVLVKMEIDVSYDDASWIDQVQDYQDSGGPWGEVVDKAENEDYDGADE